MWLNILAGWSFVLLLKYVWSRRKFYYLSWTMHGPFAFPFVGNALQFLDTSNKINRIIEFLYIILNELVTSAIGYILTFYKYKNNYYERLAVWSFPKDVMSNITETLQKYYSPLRFWLGGKFVVGFDRPEEIEVVMTSPHSIDKGKVYENVKSMIGGHGLFTIGGDSWKMHRKLLNPTIQNYNILNSFYPSFNKNMEKLIKLLEDKVAKGPFNIYNSMEACTLDMICETTFGVQMNIQDGENLSFLDSINNLMFLSGILIFQPWYQLTPIFRLSKYYNIANKSRSEARSYVKKILDGKINDFKNNVMKNESNEVDEFGKKRSNIFIDECVRLSIQQKCFTDDEMITESLTMMAGGFETTALTTSYIILMLALHPEYQEKVFQEIHDIFPEQRSDVRCEDIAKLEYTDRFIKETMRFTPTVPLITRYAKKDMHIGKHRIPAGTELIISVFNLHRNPHVWESAGVFDPDHFLPEVLRKKHPFSFVPFSAGPRNCIGLKYGNIVVRMFICWLVRNYRFSTDLKMDQLSFRMNITMKLEQKHMVYVHKRENY